MHRSLYILLPLLFATASLFAAPAQRPEDDPPPIFDKRPYAEARADAKKNKKSFIVKATAVWCAPCKQMDKTTWRDEKITAWLKQNTIAVRIDVDQQKTIARDLDIQAMPTMIAFKEGDKEFDRIAGYKAPADFLPWLEGIAKGEKSIEAIQKRAAAEPKGGTREVDARYKLAQSLVESRDYDKATNELAWVWVNSLDVPGYDCVRGALLAADMGYLASVHPAAKARFTQFRDAKTKLIAGDKVDFQDLDDWVDLNDIVGEPDRTLEWFDKVKSIPRWRPFLVRLSYRLERLLIDHKRWADIAAMYPDPIATLEQESEFLKMLPDVLVQEGMNEETRELTYDTPHRIFHDTIAHTYVGLLAAGREAEADKFATRARELDTAPGMTSTLIERPHRLFCDKIAHIYAGLLAAGREAEADKLATRALELDTGMTWMLIETALEAEQARPQQVGWLEKADDKHPKTALLLERLKAALKQKSGK